MNLSLKKTALLCATALFVFGAIVGWITRERHPGEAVTGLYGIAGAILYGGIGAIRGTIAVHVVASVIKKRPREGE